MGYWGLISASIIRIFIRKNRFLSLLNILAIAILLIVFSSSTTLLGQVIGTNQLTLLSLSLVIFISASLFIFSRAHQEGGYGTNLRPIYWQRANPIVIALTALFTLTLLPGYLLNSGFSIDTAIGVGIIVSLLGLLGSALGVISGMFIMAVSRYGIIRLGILVMLMIILSSSIFSWPVELIDGFLLRGESEMLITLLVATLSATGAAIVLFDLTTLTVGPLNFPRRYQALLSRFHLFGVVTGKYSASLVNSLVFYLRNSATRNRIIILGITIWFFAQLFSSSGETQLGLLLLGGVIGCLVSAISYGVVMDNSEFPGWLPLSNKSHQRSNWLAGAIIYTVLIKATLLVSGIGLWQMTILVAVALIVHSIITVTAMRAKQLDLLTADRLTGLTIAGTLFGLMPGAISGIMTEPEILLILAAWAGGMTLIWLFLRTRLSKHIGRLTPSLSS